METVDQMVAHGYAPFSVSPTIGKLAAALATAQASIKGAEKDRTNPHFGSKYATLDACWVACREPLSKNGLAVMQLPSSDGAKVSVTTVLAHSSGEWISSSVTVTAKDASPQSIGSALTYGRRYGLCAAVGVAPEEDDDGNAAQQAKPQGRAPEKRDTPRDLPAPPAAAAPARTVDRAEQKQMVDAADAAGWRGVDVQRLLASHGFKKSTEVTVDKLPAILDALKHGASVPPPTNPVADNVVPF